MKGFPQDILDKYYFPNVKPDDATITVEGSLDNQDLAKCDYLLIESEGYSLFSIAGARQTIKKYKPKVLMAINTDSEMTAISDVVQYLAQTDIDYDYIVNVDHHADLKQVYLYSWINHGQRIAQKPNAKRIIGNNTVGRLTPDEIKGRNMIRARTIPGSGGPDPDVYNIKFMPGRTVKFRRSKTDAWNSWYEYHSETEVRSKFWYPNIRPKDVVVDAGAAWGSYAITAALLGATAYAYEPHPIYVHDMANNVRLNNVSDKVRIYKRGLSDKNRTIDWDELKNMRLVALDEHLNKPIDFLKLDVEGQELEALKGASKTIAQYKPKILVENHLTYNHKMIPDVAELIMKLADGYQMVVFDCIPSGDTIYTYFHFKPTQSA